MRSRNFTTAHTTAILTTWLATAACHSPAASSSAAQEPVPASAAGQTDPQLPAITDQPLHKPGLYNVVRYSEHCVGGAVPEGETGLRELAAMGVKTIISVDGAVPDVDGASKLGMSYIHLPISYNGIQEERQQQLAQAIANAPGPIYVHCHHGKHRSAAALASALVLAGELTPAVAMSRMEVSGTAKGYQGLWRAVATAQPLPQSALQADWRQFPKIATVTGLVATMSEIDSVWDNVKQLQQNAFQTPQDHPDLVPLKETRRLASLYAQLAADPDSKQRPAAYQALLQEAIVQSAALATAVANGDQVAAAAQFLLLQKGCKECHQDHRDV